MPTRSQRRLERPPRQLFADWSDVPLACSVFEAATVLGISRESVFALIRRGLLPSVKVGGRRVVTKAALRAYLDDGVNAAAR
jgi:excisionase family DNA binding protein